MLEMPLHNSGMHWFSPLPPPPSTSSLPPPHFCMLPWQHKLAITITSLLYSYVEKASGIRCYCCLIPLIQWKHCAYTHTHTLGVSSPVMYQWTVLCATLVHSGLAQALWMTLYGKQSAVYCKHYGWTPNWPTLSLVVSWGWGGLVCSLVKLINKTKKCVCRCFCLPDRITFTFVQFFFFYLLGFSLI